MADLHKDEDRTGLADGHGVLACEYADDLDLWDVIEGFVGRLHERVGQMRHSLAHNDLEEVRRLAHQLKGAGGSYGYPALTDASRVLEQAAKAGDAEAANLALAGLARLCQAAVRGWARPSKA